jgi:hypothetical protein
MGTGHPSVAPMNAEARLIRLQCLAAAESAYPVTAQIYRLYPVQRPCTASSNTARPRSVMTIADWRGASGLSRKPR